MRAVEKLLRALVESPKRWWIVISLTLLTGLVTLWPAADEYVAAGKERSEIEDSTKEAEDQIAQLPALAKQSTQKAEALAELERRSNSTTGKQSFRDEVVEMVRRTGCRVQGVEASDPSRRQWREQDHPLTPSAGEKQKETPFDLTTQQVSLSVAGPMENVREFLGALQATERFYSTSSFVLRPVEPDRKEAVLDMTLFLYGLEARKKTAG